MRGPGAGIGGQNDNPSCDPAHDGLPPCPRRRGHQHNPRLARTRLDQHDQHLCRDRPHAEGQRRRALRGGAATARSLMEGGQGSHGLSEIIVSPEVRYGLLRLAFLYKWWTRAARRPPS